MTQTNTALRASGTWLAVGGLLLAGALAFHGPPSPVLAEQMGIIAAGSTRWAIVHWTAAVALSSFAIAGLIALTAASRLTDSPASITAWAVLTVGALWTMTTAVIEATAISQLAGAGDAALFAPWWDFSEGKANGFAALAVAVTAIAAHEARSREGSMPTWLAWTGAAVATGSFAGWVLDSWLDVAVGGLLWVASSLAMCLWLVWFGLTVARTESEALGKQPTLART